MNKKNTGWILTSMFIGQCFIYQQFFLISKNDALQWMNIDLYVSLWLVQHITVDPWFIQTNFHNVDCVIFRWKGKSSTKSGDQWGQRSTCTTSVEKFFPTHYANFCEQRHEMGRTENFYKYLWTKPTSNLRSVSRETCDEEVGVWMTPTITGVGADWRNTSFVTEQSRSVSQCLDIS